MVSLEIACRIREKLHLQGYDGSINVTTSRDSYGTVIISSSLGGPTGAPPRGCYPSPRDSSPIRINKQYDVILAIITIVQLQDGVQDSL